MSIDISNVYPNQDLKVDLKTRQPPLFVGDGAATFPTTSDYAQTAASADLALGETYTLCAWVRSVKPDGANHAVNIGVSGNTKASIAFFGGVSNPEVYCFNGASNMNTYGTFQSDPHTWYHIAMVIKPGAGNSQIFINGIDRTAPHSHTFPLSGSPVLHIGGYYATGNGDWQGDLANVALFTSSLTEDQVRQAMRAWDYASHAAIATLEAFYPLSTNFNDSTGNHNATASGSPQFRPNRPQLPRGLDFSPGRSGFARSHTGRAVDFDGSADYLDIGRKDFGTGDFSISLWFYDQQSSGGNRSLYSKGTYNTVGGLLIYNVYGATGPSEYLMFRNDDQASGGLYDDRLIITTEPTSNAWHHIAVTRTGGTVKGYFDGKLVNTSTNFNPAWDINASLNSFIGARDPSSPGSFWDGFISSVKVWDTVLTDAQVAEQFHNPEQVLPTGTSASNLDRYYPLSDYNDTGGTGGRWFQDMGADGEPAEDLGSALMAFGQSVPCPQLGLQQSSTRLLFPGGTTTHNAVATTTALGTNASVSCWFQCNNTSPVGLIWSVGLSGTNHWYTYIQSGKITIGPANINIGTVTEGAWTHLVVTTDSGSPPYKAYVNGAEVSLTGTHTARNLTSGSFEIGNQDVASTPFVFTGILNDVACWNTELSLSDAQSLYNSGVMGMDVSTVQSANLKGWWKCDDLTSFKDYSGNGANATVTNTFAAASFPVNASGSTIVGDFSMKRKGDSVFNFTGGGDSRLELAANPDILPAVSGGYTFSAFVRLQTTGSDQAIMMSSATGVDEWGTYYNSSNNKYYVVLSNGSSNISDRAFTNTVTDNEWHHIAWTLDLSQEPAVGETYLDGVSDTSFTRTGMNTPPAASSFGIGYDPGNSNKEAFAAISSLKIYQRVLSADEIKSVYLSDERMIRGNKNE